MSTWQVAHVREQGVEFSIVCVQDSVIENAIQRENLLQAWSAQLNRPVALLGAQQHRVYGHRNVVDFVGSVHPSRFPWQQVTLAG